jgi:ATP-dependent Clp protease protease subunit
MVTSRLAVASKGDVVEIMLYGAIGRDWLGDGDGVTAKEFRAEVKKAKGKGINLRVNSPGGSVFEGSAMKAALDEHQGDVTVDVDGLAASAASFLIMGADTIRVASNALVMIHNPMSGVLGTAEDMRREAELLDKVRDQIIDAYLERSGAAREQLAAWMDAETWFTGQEAVDAGLADEATRAVQVAAFAGAAELFAKLGYRKAPALPEAAARPDPGLAEETRKRREIAARL